MSAAYSALAAGGIAVAPSPEDALRLARAAELGEVREVRARRLSPYGCDTWTLRDGRISLACRGTVTAVLFDREDLRRLVSVVAGRLEARS